MKQKLIVTLWKAQFKKQNALPNKSIYCRLNYNNQYRDSKHLDNKKSLQWKETFVFPLKVKKGLSNQIQQSISDNLRIDFITLKKGQEIHFAKNNVAETMSSAHSIFQVPSNGPNRGSLPAKMDIIDQDNEVLGKVFIQYEILKTEVTYLVQKLIDYNYLLKLSSFKVTFLRNLKKVPNFYLKLIYGNNKIHKEDFAFQQENQVFYYNYPIKLHMNKEIQMKIQLQVKQFFGGDLNSAHQSLRSDGLTDKKSQFSSINNIKRNTLDLGLDKISTTLDLASLKSNTNTMKKLSLTSPFKSQQREIGFIQFQLQAFFKTTQEKQALKQQKKGIAENPQSTQLVRKRKPLKSTANNNIQQGNGHIIISTIMGKLQLFNDDIIKDKDIQLTLKLGKQIFQSSVLENPGKQLIFIDEFTFKRTWQQTVKFTIDIYNQDDIKKPLFYSSVNLRQLFEKGKLIGKKAKIQNQQKQYCGELTLEMEYRQDEKKNLKQQRSRIMSPKMSLEEQQQKLLQQKRDKIAERMKKRQEQKQAILEEKKIAARQKQRQIVTMADALDLKNLILPPLKTRNFSSNQSMTKSKRYMTLSPTHKQQHFKGANMYNSNGGIKFSRSPRFNSSKERSSQSFMFNRQSDFDPKLKKGTFIGYGDKHDFTKDCKANPGIGRYEIPSLWDKYNN